MREIKFRGYDTDDKVWRYGFYMQKNDTILCFATENQIKENEHHLILFGGFCDWNMPRPYYQSEVDGNSIGQYTGLHDKNGKEIYEGDIVTIDSEGKDELFVIEWTEDTARFSMVQCGSLMYDFDNYWSSELTVVGNIYENPELIGE